MFFDRIPRANSGSTAQRAGWVCFLSMSLGGGLPCMAVGEDASSADGFKFFETTIRPILVERCFDCHNEDAAESDLRLDSLAGMLRGGTRGPALIVGKPDESLLISAIRHGESLKMPPKSKLPQSEIRDIIRWVEQGSPWPNAKPIETTKDAMDLGGDSVFSETQRSFWSLQPLNPADLPPVQRRDWVRAPVDAFILARMESDGLSPAKMADKRTWLRRATFDLTGLPPTLRETQTFLNDESPNAFAKVVDRLLGSPQYGERWARHWLDVARYADSNGLDENLAYANAYHYRDYVVSAFNRDKLFDDFVREQLAGDLLDHVGNNRIEAITATGFLSLGAKMLAEDDPVKMQMDIIDEQVDTVGRAFMGLTLGCARCHDHKFDPISTRDYYALAGIFKSTKTMEHFKVVARWQERPLGTADAIEARDHQQQQVDGKQAKIDAVASAAAETVLQQARGHVGQYLLAAWRLDQQRELLARATWQRSRHWLAVGWFLR